MSIQVVQNACIQMKTLATDPRERADYWHDNKKELLSYGALVVTTIVTWFAISSGEFSFSLTLGSLISMFSFLVMGVCIETSRSCQGVSAKMLEVECYALICSHVEENENM